MKQQVFITVIITSFIFLGLNDNSTLKKPLFNDNYNFIAINEIKMWISNNGDGSHDPNTDGNGLYWPGGVDEPEFSGDEMLWYVANDLDSGRCYFTYGGYPIGLEFQVTTYAYKTEWLLGDVIFKKYLIINKGDNIVEDMIFSYWVAHYLYIQG